MVFVTGMQIKSSTLYYCVSRFFFFKKYVVVRTIVYEIQLSVTGFSVCVYKDFSSWFPIFDPHAIM